MVFSKKNLSKVGNTANGGPLIYSTIELAHGTSLPLN